MISYFCDSINFKYLNKVITKKWINTVIHNHHKKCGSINIIFCSDPYILEINKRFLSHNFYTDIITFDYCTLKIVSGDLYISIDSVSANAIFYKQSFDDELHRVIIHGILHLLGYDDHTVEQSISMRDAENSSLLLLNVK